MPWLLRDGTVLAALEENRSSFSNDFEGAVLASRWRFVHTFGFPDGLDLACCARSSDQDGAQYLVVRRDRSLAARRISLPRPACAALLIARRGSFERWGLRSGQRLEVRSP
jgi:hypothetical protein